MTKETEWEKPDETTGLNPRQEKFVRLYTQNDELFGNATLSYAEAYGYNLDEMVGDERKKMYDSCSAQSSRLLRIDKIQKRKIELLNELLKNEIVDAKLAELIKGGDMMAIREYNKLKGRITDKMDISGKAFEHFTGQEKRYGD